MFDPSGPGRSRVVPGLRHTENRRAQSVAEPALYGLPTNQTERRIDHYSAFFPSYRSKGCNELNDSDKIHTEVGSPVGRQEVAGRVEIAGVPRLP